MGLEEEVNVLCALTLRKRGTSESRQELMESEMKKNMVVQQNWGGNPYNRRKNDPS